MLSVQTLARRIRQRLHDNDCITYADEEILDCINCGIRFIRRIIATLRPALLMSETEGTLAAGENKITLGKPPMKIINVVANGEALEETDMAFAIHETLKTAEKPQGFFQTGKQTINFFPTPTAPTNYTIRTVDDIEELNWSDNSPLLTEFDDFLVEYAVIRLGTGNEYDMTQETQMLSSIAAQIQQILIPPPVGIIKKGYWR